MDIYNSTIWNDLGDKPEDFKSAIKNAISVNEKEFFENMLYKITSEPTELNDLFLDDDENEDGIFFYRICQDEFMIGREPSRDYTMCEYGWLFGVLNHDMFEYLGRHITFWEWLRERDYRGVRYDRNYDFLI